MGECKHEWGIDGQHSNEYCKKCFINKPPGGWLNCPHCGSTVEHKSTCNTEFEVGMEIVQCTMCPALMAHDGSEAALKSMWNFRTK